MPFLCFPSRSIISKDIDNDAVLDGVDSATEKSINGPRVTNLVAAFVNGTPQRYQTFLTVVRCVRKWAKARGLYSNKMGYWGGVNINIAVAQCLQLYPNACPASLLRKFFLVFKTWRWPQPVMLTKPHDAGYGLPVWSAQTSMRQVAPMITPAYPAMNSTLSVSRQTLQILQEEFNRGHEIVDGLWKQFQRSPSSDPVSLDWNALFQNSDFFISYPNYLSLCIVGPSQIEAQAWAGFVESRLRKLVSDQLARSLPLKKIQLWPKKLEACVADQGALLTAAQRQNSITYFVGFYVDKIRMRGDHLNIEIALQNFRDWELSRYQPLLPGMDVLVKNFRVKELPLLCFQDMYEGGKLEAMKKRRHFKTHDPVRQEKKRVARLNELKAKMAEIQKKKEEQQQQEQDDRKRKREESGDTMEDDEEAEANAENSAAVVVKAEEDENAQNEVNEESNMLESALDTVNQKTKEEAESDRQKLLAGELIASGGRGPGGDEDNDEDSSDDEDLMYAGDDARSSFLNQVPKIKKKRSKKSLSNEQDSLPNNEQEDAAPTMTKDIRSLPISQERANFLKQLGCHIVRDEDAKVLGADLLPPWRFDKDLKDDNNTGKPNRSRRPLDMVDIKSGSIRFAKPFDIVELDAHGHVIDKGDDDFSPSKNWSGRRAGFEFKLGERGLGYYRTGTKVVVPSNRAY